MQEPNRSMIPTNHFNRHPTDHSIYLVGQPDLNHCCYLLRSLPPIAPHFTSRVDPTDEGIGTQLGVTIHESK